MSCWNNERNTRDMLCMYVRTDESSSILFDVYSEVAVYVGSILIDGRYGEGKTKLHYNVGL